MGFVGEILIKLGTSSFSAPLMLTCVGLCGVEVWKLIGAIRAMISMKIVKKKQVQTPLGQAQMFLIMFVVFYLSYEQLLFSPWYLIQHSDFTIIHQPDILIIQFNATPYFDQYQPQWHRQNSQNTYQHLVVWGRVLGCDYSRENWPASENM